MSPAQPARRCFFILLIAASVLLAFVVRPIASALFLAAVLAGVLWPVHQRLSKLLRGRRGLSAAAFVIGVVILLLGPVVAFSTFAITEGGEGLRFLSETVRGEGVTGLVDRLPPQLGGPARQALDRLSAQGEADLPRSFQKQVSEQSGKAAIAVGATLSATGAFVFQTAMMLIAFYFLLLEGDHLVIWLDELSPLKRGQTQELLTEFKKVSFAVILSTVITSAIQAAAALGGYFIARVPHPIFFAGVTFFAAFIPAIGAAAVCLVAALLLFATGHPYAALFLSLWGLIVVGLVDNLVKPLLIKVGMQMNGAVVFFSLVGGLSAFGGVGLLLGPLVVALFLSLLRMYERDFKPLHHVPSDG
jgi:predicted PurR-regulated permease PerM